MRAKQFVGELNYPGNIGMMEFVKFQKIATPEQKVRMKLLLATDKKAAWEYLQQVTNTKLQEQVLYEIDMSPSNLRKLAAQTGAIAGMEFEMVVKGFGEIDGDAEYEPDYDSDERSRSFDNIENFFYDGNYNSRSDVNRLISKLQDRYSEYSNEQLHEAWQDERDGFFRDEMIDQFDFDTTKDDVAKELGLDVDSDKVSKRVEELFDEFLEDEWEKQGRLYNNAYESWREDADYPTEREFLDDFGLGYMSDVQSEYSGVINWPYYTITDNEGDIETIANSFSDAVGRPVIASSSYHGATRRPGKYVLEPDSSINADDGGSGLEFVSPPLPIDQLLNDLNETMAWAKENDCYTNNSTGLHMNVSIPNKDFKNLDYTKLALLLGDTYILQKFGRESNSYTKSALQKIKNDINSRPPDFLLKQMRSGLNKLALDAIIGNYGKYTSIHPKEGYVEFRSPGGDWLEEDISTLENTLLRFVVALDAALDPEKYRKEYLKKLYQILQPKSNNDLIAYFAQYSAGVLPKSALKSFVKQAQLQRDVQRNKPQVEGTYLWKVTLGTLDTEGVEVAAASKEEAFKKAAVRFGLSAEAMNALINQNKFIATPIRPYQETPIPTGTTKYEVYMADEPNTVIGTFYGRTNDTESARLGFRSFMNRMGRNSTAGYGYRIARD